MSDHTLSDNTTPFTASDGDLPDSCYAYVPDPETPSTRKLKLCGSDGKPDKGVIAAAKAALGKGYRGNRVQLPASARSGVIAKVNAAAKSVGIEPFSASEDDVDPLAFDDGPTQADVHQDGAIGAVGPMGALNKMRGRLKGKLRHGRTLTQDDIDEAHTFAKRHAAAMSEADETIVVEHDEANDGNEVIAPMGYGELIEKPDYRLFQEIKSAAEIPDRIHYLPVPGTYKHPSYGEVEITPERNARFVANFKDRIYGQDIPIDAEHQTKLSGAMGHIKELVQNSDGSVDAIPTWTPNGRKLLSDGAFRYFSPEWFDSWRNPADGVTHQDVPIGGALTNRPFFKEGSLRPLAASEGHLYLVTHAERGAATELVFDEFELITPSQRQGAKPMAEENKTAATGLPVAMTEEQITKRFAEIESKHASEIAALKSASEEQATKLAAEVETERTARVAAEDAARIKKFTDEVRGRSDANGSQWIGDVKAKVATLDHLAKTAGEESDVFKSYVADQRAVAAQLKDSTLFKSFGTDASSDGGNSATERLNIKAQAYADDKHVTFAEAFDAIAQSDSKLYAEARAEGRN